jgi:hypothetical protein
MVKHLRFTGASFPELTPMVKEILVEIKVADAAALTKAGAACRRV